MYQYCVTSLLFLSLLLVACCFRLYRFVSWHLPPRIIALPTVYVHPILYQQLSLSVVQLAALTSVWLVSIPSLPRERVDSFERCHRRRLVLVVARQARSSAAAQRWRQWRASNVGRSEQAITWQRRGRRRWSRTLPHLAWHSVARRWLQRLGEFGRTWSSNEFVVLR